MNTIILDDTLKSLKAVLASAIATTQPTYTVHYGDATATSFIEGSGDGALNSVTPVTILAAPSASTRRIVREITVYNGDTVNVVLSLSLDNNGTDRMIRKVTIKPGETYSFSENSASNQFGEVSLVWDSTPATGVYGLLGGAVDGVNTVFTTSLAGYVSGSLMVYLNGQLLTTNNVDWSETSPTTGTFTFVIPPVTLDVITVSYQRAYLASGNADTLDGSHSSSFMPVVVPSTQGNILQSTGSVWQSSTPPSNRNAIINGAMDIWQRGTATLTNPATGTYFPDRFKSAHVMGDGTYNLLSSAETPTATFPFKNSLQFDITHIETAVAAGEFAIIRYSVEGYDFARFEEQTATLSFWVKAVKTGIYCVSLQNDDSTKSYVHEFTINSASTWEKKTVVLAFNSGGTFLYTNGIGLMINWSIMNGSARQTTSANKDTWQSGNYFSTDAQVNGMDNVANNFYLTGVQMELGSVATPFEFRPYGTELALCQRYYEYFGGTSGSITHKGYHAGASSGFLTLSFKVEKRVAPTCSVAGTFAVSNSGQPIISNASVSELCLSNLVTGAGDYYYQSNGTDDLFIASAEL